MQVIYDVTIKPTEKNNHFNITWHNPENKTIDSFNQEAEITTNEAQILWQYSEHQASIGGKLLRFLDGDSRHFHRALEEAGENGELLQLNLDLCEFKQTADWPFELLAESNTFLLPHRVHLLRRVSDWGSKKEVPPKKRPLKLLFMACSALDIKPELDFEREGETIFRITKGLPIDIEVEDSGSPEGLRIRLEKEKYDVVYLSGYAGIEQGNPYFIMENETGYAHQVFPDKLWDEALIENPPRLLFLSVCRIGEAVSMVEFSFGRLLVEKYPLPAVLGWGRSVSDEQAIHAGMMLFRELSRGKTVLEAVQRARFELKNSFPDSDKPTWPLLRLFSSGMPLNPIVKVKQRLTPKSRETNYIEFKQKKVKVLKEGFVGRRRQLQKCLMALKEDDKKVGVLLLGTAGLGKSCLAGKLCERFPNHILIIVHGKLKTTTLKEALEDAFIKARDKRGQRILSQRKGIKEKLHDFCSSIFKNKNYLLFLDDFEQNLEGADKGQPGPLMLEASDLMKTLLHYLHFSGKMTQLIITSRYSFSLTEQDQDLVEERLEKVWLTSFQEGEQHKKLRRLKNIFNLKDQSLATQLLSAGHGNPYLMEWLDILVGQTSVEEVPNLLEAIKNKQEDFIRQHIIRELLERSGKNIELFLQWLSIYRRPVLKDGIELAAKKAGFKDWEKLLHQGMSLSLVEYDHVHQTYQVTPLLREELVNRLK